MMKRWVNIVIVFSSILIVYQCKLQTSNNVVLDITQQPFEKLSQYHFFKGKISDLIPNDRVIPYDLITPLFTDYAEKARFVYMPEGSVANYVKDEVIEFPQGTVLIKNFFYYNDVRQPEKGKRIIETRLLVHTPKGWNAIDYIWNDEQTDAILDVVGDNKQVSWIDAQGKQQATNYSIPNKNQCKNCHNIKNVLMPIGPKVRYLNHDFNYTDGVKNQLEKWTTLGILKGYDATSNVTNKIAKWDDIHSGTLEERAKSYLEVNCAHCHRPEGNANTSGLFLQIADKNPESWGVLKSPVAAGKGSGDRLYDVVPGKPEESILPYRMESLDLDAMMPELGRTMVHHEGVALIKEWIAQMPNK